MDEFKTKIHIQMNIKNQAANSGTASLIDIS